MEARLERRRKWAESRERKGEQASERVHQIADGIPFGQPILVGHHSERGARADERRTENGIRSAVENWGMAKHHGEKADGIERQLRTSIFSDDGDAVEKLEAKIAKLEAKRDAAKVANAAYRRDHRVELRRWARTSGVSRSRSPRTPSIGARRSVGAAASRGDRSDGRDECQPAIVAAGGRCLAGIRVSARIAGRRSRRALRLSGIALLARLYMRRVTMSRRWRIPDSLLPSYPPWVGRPSGRPSFCLRLGLEDVGVVGVDGVEVGGVEGCFGEGVFGWPHAHPPRRGGRDRVRDAWLSQTVTHRDG